MTDRTFLDPLLDKFRVEVITDTYYMEGTSISGAQLEAKQAIIDAVRERLHSAVRCGRLAVMTEHPEGTSVLEAENELDDELVIGFMRETVEDDK